MIIQYTCKFKKTFINQINAELDNLPNKHFTIENFFVKNRSIFENLIFANG